MRVNSFQNYNYGPLNLYNMQQKSAVAFGHAIKPEIIYDDRGFLSKIKFKQPISLKDVSEFFLRPEMERNLFSFTLSRLSMIGLMTSRFAEEKITELLGYGGQACAFLLENGNVLKLSEGEHMRRKQEDFDIPIYEHGLLFTGYLGDLCYYIEQYADTEASTKEEILNLINKIEAKGYKIQDAYKDCWKEELCYEQFGKTSDGKLYLLDPECAIPIEDITKLF